jgi:hypothetical protein
VPDSTTSAIDRVFDLVDDFADRADRVLNRTKHTEDQHRIRRARRADVDTSPSVKVRSTSTALATRRFQIVEAIDSVTGTTAFIVTNGDVKAECTSRALAEKILHALETAP